MYVIIGYRDFAHAETKRIFKPMRAHQGSVSVCGPFDSEAAAQSHVQWLSGTWTGVKYEIMPVVSAVQQISAVTRAGPLMGC